MRGLLRNCLTGLVAVAMILNAGCGTPARDPGGEIDDSALAACTSGMSQSDIDNNLQITMQFDESVHEMIVCGGLTVTLIGAVIQVGYNMAVGEATGSAPDGMVYQDGKYLVDVQGVNAVKMEVEFFYGADYEVGKTGEPIKYDLLDPNNYLVGASGEFSLSKGKGTVTFDSTGPLVELLGFGATPESPKTLSLNDLNQLTAEFGKITMRSTIVVNEEKGTSNFGYNVKTEDLKLSEVLGTIQYNVVSVSGSRSDTSQSLATTSWDVKYADGVHGLDGTITFDVTGGDFDYSVLFEYPSTPSANITYECK